MKRQQCRQGVGLKSASPNRAAMAVAQSPIRAATTAAQVGAGGTGAHALGLTLQMLNKVSNTGESGTQQMGIPTGPRRQQHR